MELLKKHKVAKIENRFDMLPNDIITYICKKFVDDNTLFHFGLTCKRYKWVWNIPYLYQKQRYFDIRNGKTNCLFLAKRYRVGYELDAYYKNMSSDIFSKTVSGNFRKYFFEEYGNLFDNLPNGFLSRVCELLDDNSLFNFGLTCKKNKWLWNMPHKNEKQRCDDIVNGKTNCIFLTKRYKKGYELEKHYKKKYKNIVIKMIQTLNPMQLIDIENGAFVFREYEASKIRISLWNLNGKIDNDLAHPNINYYFKYGFEAAVLLLEGLNNNKPLPIHIGIMIGKYIASPLLLQNDDYVGFEKCWDEDKILSEFITRLWKCFPLNEHQLHIFHWILISFSRDNDHSTDDHHVISSFLNQLIIASNGKILLDDGFILLCQNYVQFLKDVMYDIGFSDIEDWSIWIINAIVKYNELNFIPKQFWIDTYQQDFIKILKYISEDIIYDYDDVFDIVKDFIINYLGIRL